MVKSIFFAFFLVGVIVFTSSAAAEDVKKNYPFNPSKIESDDGWEEVFVTDGYEVNWCGTYMLFTRNKLIDTRNWEIRKILFPKDYSHRFAGCTPDSRYFFARRIPRKKAKDKTMSIVIYDTKIMKEVDSLLIEKAERTLNLLSPSGKHLLGYSRGKIKLNEKDRITILPFLSELSENLHEIAWAPDGGKIYFLTNDNPQKLIVYDLLKANRRVIELEMDEHYFGYKMKVSPGGERIYILCGIKSGFHLIKVENLFVLDLTDLNSIKSKVRPKLLGKIFSSFDMGPGGIIVFNMVPNPEERSSFPAEFSGIFLADSNGNIFNRLTAGTNDVWPKFSKDGRTIAFTRIVIEPKRWISTVRVLKKTD